MGIPLFYNWLVKKYPSVMCDLNPEEVTCGNDSEASNNAKPIQNQIECDHLYLDMNSIIHDCSNPEDRPAPLSEDEVIIAIFETIDQLVVIARPRKLLFISIDGVPPRAKLAKQRAGHFKDVKESKEIAAKKKCLRADKLIVPNEKQYEFDINFINPGTPFMQKLAACLRFYVHLRLNADWKWKNISVILSDSSVPGEGEHKIVDFIRGQRCASGHAHNIRHVLYSPDSDVILLGLATHEEHVSILRSKKKKTKLCEICRLPGHKFIHCQGVSSQFEENLKSRPIVQVKKSYEYLRLCVLRERLGKELRMYDLACVYDSERAVDDWVFLCFLLGNDFLPRLPSLAIWEKAMDLLVKLYKECVATSGGWLTKNKRRSSCLLLIAEAFYLWDFVCCDV